MTDEISAERHYAERASLVLAGLGLPPAYGKLLGWLLICDPPVQSTSEMARALDLSKGSVSTGIRMLEGAQLVRRVAVPGRRGTFYEMTPDAIMRAAGSDKFTAFRELLEDGIAVVGGEEAPAAARLRVNRDFYAFLEREVPQLVERFKAEYDERGR